jgi:outer membrane immunogenic protein
MPVKAAPAPVAVGYSWTGCYVGVGGGYGMFNQETQYNVAGPVGLTVDNGGRGWFATVQVGCDYQVGSNIVIGAFGDYDWSDISGTMNTGAFGGGFIGEEKLKSSWAAGGRIGYLPFQSQQLLVYVSGGYTQARFDAVAFTSPFGGAPNGAGLVKHTYDGWFIGSGYEYQFGWLPIQGLTWKTEYRFADYGSDLVQLTGFAGPIVGNYLDNHKYVQTIRSELVWRFNFGSPVVAR